MYELNASERRLITHIMVSLFNNKKVPTKRVIDFIVDYIARLSQDPIPAEYLPYIALITPYLEALRAIVSSKKTKKGMVTEEVSLFDEKMLELPALLTNLESKARLAYPGDEITMKFLLFTDREAFRIGGQQEQLDTLNGWLLRIETKTLIPDVLTEAKDWVHDTSLLLSTKVAGHGGVRGATLSETALRINAFSAMRETFGDLYSEHAKDLRVILTLYNPNLLKHDKSDPDKFLSNQFPMILGAGLITTSIDGTYVPKGSVITDNKKNISGVWTWLSMTAPTSKPDYAKFTAGGTSGENSVLDLGPKYAKYYNAMFDDTKAIGSLKITVKKRK